MQNRTVIVNAGRMDYDHSLPLDTISDVLTVYESSTAEEIVARVQGMDIAITKEVPVTAEMIAAFPDTLRLIVEAGTGYNNIDLAAARSRGITVCNVPAYSSERVAHTAIMLMLCLSSCMQQQMAMLSHGDHRNFTQHLLCPHVELNGKALGIIGYGNIGRAVIKIARAMDMNVLVSTRTPREDADGIRFVDRDTLLRESDYVSLHCPLTPATRHIINADALSRMKSTAFLINTARGALIDEPALITALQNGTIAGAGLDVQETEPPREDNPLYTMPNVILTPHMGWKGRETRERLIRIVADDVHAFLDGHPINVVS